jgi:cytochrome c oxidase cbb3-type subunit III
MAGRTILTFCAVLALAAAPAARAQDEAGGAQAGRGGRGGRGGSGGAARTHDFLGLPPAPDAAAAQKGQPIYEQNCSACHGPNAHGAQGPSLVRSVVVLHDTNGEGIGPVVRSGRPEAGMPAFSSLSADDISNLAAYLHEQVELAANRGTYSTEFAAERNRATGDPKEGEAFFNGAGGCAKCHSATGDLAGIAAKYPQAALMQSRIVWPTQPGPTNATITTASGETVTGALRSLTDYDVTLVDAAGVYHYWPRSAVKVNVEDKLASHRALLPKLSDADIHNLTAYLETLK